MDVFKLSRNWFDFSFENPEKIKPNHTALYFFIIEHCNRLGWKNKFGLPTTMAKEAIGISSYNTYVNTLNDLIDWGFIKLIEKSKNQYSSNIIAISNFDKALDKALDKAIIKHGTKQSESTDSINIQETININETKKKVKEIPYFEEFKKYALENKPNININSLELKYKSWVENGWKNGNGKEIKNWKSNLLNTLPYIAESKEQNKLKYLSLDEIRAKGLNIQRKYVWTDVDGRDYAGLMSDDEKSRKGIPVEKIMTINNNEVI